MSIKLNNRLATLARFASKDATRWTLHQVYRDETKQVCVATDGRRLLVDNLAYGVCDCSYDANVYLKTGRLLSPPSDARFPNWTQLIPNIDDKFSKMTIKLPDSIKHLSKFKDPFRGFFTKEGKITINTFNDDTPPVFSLDLRLLDVFGGETVTIYYKDDKSPVVVKLESDNDITAVIMPMG